MALATSELERRRDVFGYDALAWALYRNDRLAEAADAIEQALRLGTRDAALHFHAGLIFAGLGERARAVDHLQTVQEINPQFSLLHAELARTTLEELLASASARP